MMRSLWAGLLGLYAGCTEASPALTQVIVLVGGDSDVRSLDVRVYDAKGTAMSDSLQIDLDRRDPSRLPTSFTVVPAASNASDRFRIVVQGFDEDAAGIRHERALREAVVAFTPGETTLLPLVLSAACADERCGCVAGEPCAKTCTPSLDAQSGAGCQPVPTYEQLSIVNAGGELDALRAGIDGCPRGTVPAFDGACEDLDECAFYIDECQVKPRACVNLPPAHERYACACPPGYAGTGEADDQCVPESVP